MFLQSCLMHTISLGLIKAKARNTRGKDRILVRALVGRCPRKVGETGAQPKLWNYYNAEQ